ncbi:MAG: trypsin-like peptidase domain-containing protein [Bacteroidia bacterium]|nr:trypsin-like peptidase domain-containing protein [Bacteroidia bacterium]
MDDFFDDDFLDFDNEDDFEEFNQSQSLISRFNLFVDSLSTKHYLAFGGVVLLLITGYFINYRFSAPQNEVAENEYLTSSTTVASTTSTTVASTTSTTVKDQNITNTLDPLGSTVMVALPECGYMGSGTVISKLGFIMTNEHVIADDGTNCNDYIVILTSESGDKDPEPKYLAEIVENNVTLDIAILEITATFDGSPLQKSFRNRCIGDSDTISLGDELLIWGYPDVRWVNFDTPGRIDVSQGFVSGFDAENGLSDKAWISLSSTISSGNSGGGAYNDSGQLVGVPTAVFQGNLSSRGLLRPINLILQYFDLFYFDKCN